MKRKITTLNQFGKIRMKALEDFQKTGDAKAVAEKMGISIFSIYKWNKWYEEKGVEALNAPMKPETESKKKIDLEEVELKILDYQSLADYDDLKHIRAEMLVKLAQGFKPNYVAEKFSVAVQQVYQIRLRWIREKII